VRRTVCLARAECENFIKLKREPASKGDCRIVAVDVYLAARGYYRRSTLGSSFRRALGEYGVIDANLGGCGRDMPADVDHG
jgi:hypothetical protein